MNATGAARMVIATSAAERRSRQAVVRATSSTSAAVGANPKRTSRAAGGRSTSMGVAGAERADAPSRGAEVEGLPKITRCGAEPREIRA